MPTNTYVALYTANLVGLNSASFTNIPQTYTDLVVVFSGQDAATSASGLSIGINSTYSGGLYSFTVMEGNGSSAYSYRSVNQNSIGISVSGGTNLPGNAIINFQNYSNTTTFKSILTRYNASNAFVGARVDLFRSTSAITRLDFFPYTANWAAGATISVYGIAATSVGAKATGGIISSDSQYYYHTFLSTGTFTPLQSLTCDTLVVAGGGGGGGGLGGGGGAGGFRTATGLSVTATNYTVTVGAGGAAGNPSTLVTGSVGVNSVFSTITSSGGGGGAGANPGAPTTGGSGGGGTYNKTTGAAGNSGGYSPVEGFAGGTGFAANPNFGGGGGGGASAIGGTYVVGVGAGVGGAGVTSSFSGTSVTYAGGGGGAFQMGTGAGGLGGAGGGGNGGNSNSSGTETQVATSGTANTGGGGGSSYTAGAGGSGIVIVRYAK